jgi:hypothetical protein
MRDSSERRVGVKSIYVADSRFEAEEDGSKANVGTRRRRVEKVRKKGVVRNPE